LRLDVIRPTAGQIGVAAAVAARRRSWSECAVHPYRHQRAFTLLELLLVLGLMAIMAAMVMPSLFGRFTRAQLPESANKMRALLQLTRANAMLEGRRHRVRFPREDELDGLGERRQPIIEVEDDPIEAPDDFRPVLDSWAQDETLHRGVRCVRVRLGKPTIELLLGEVEEDQRFLDDLEEDQGEKFEEGFPPLIFETDGTSEWATYVLTDAPPDIEYEDLEVEGADVDYTQIEVILDGLLGLAWLQRPLYEEELDMMRENGWPPVMRKDFLNPVALTEDNVLEIQETAIRR
jgi:prepilin-type N-terminal cleavage/methylation domain-containing protein